MEYHAVAHGSCWAGIPGGPSVQLFAGDVVMFPHGDAHVMSSAPGMRGVADPDWYAGIDLGRLPLRVGYRGRDPVDPASPEFHADTTVVCGFLGCDLHPFNPLIEALPHLMCLRSSEDDAWMRMFTQQVVAESQSGRPGGEAMLARMSEMMFVHAVRRYADGLPEQSAGWVTGLRDRFVGRTPAARNRRQRRLGGARRRLRIGGGLRARFQAVGRQAGGGVAPRARGIAGVMTYC